MSDYVAKIDQHLNAACKAEAEGNKELAEKEWKFAVFYEARSLGIDSKQHIADVGTAY